MPAVHRYTKNGSFAPGFLPPLVQTPPHLSAFRLSPTPFDHSHNRLSLPPVTHQNANRSNSEPILNGSDKFVKADEPRRKRKNNRRRTDMFRTAMDSKYRAATPMPSPKVRPKDTSVDNDSLTNSKRTNSKSVKLNDNLELILRKRRNLDQNNNEKQLINTDKNINRSGSLLNMRIPRSKVRHRVYKPLPKVLPNNHSHNESITSETATTSSTATTGTTATTASDDTTKTDKQDPTNDKPTKTHKKEHLSPEEQEAKDQENEDLVKHSTHVKHVQTRKDVAAKYHFRSIIGELKPQSI